MARAEWRQSDVARSLALAAVASTALGQYGVLAERDVNAWSQMPVWVPPQDGMEGFHTVDVSKAIAAGVIFLLTYVPTLMWMWHRWFGLAARR